jgi:hypothetical protein
MVAGPRAFPGGVLVHPEAMRPDLRRPGLGLGQREVVETGASAPWPARPVRDGFRACVAAEEEIPANRAFHTSCGIRAHAQIPGGRTRPARQQKPPICRQFDGD